MTVPLRPMVPTPLTVRRVRRETPDTFTIHLDAADARDDFAFLPGQFNMLYMFGVGEVPISISGDPARPEDLVHTIRAVGMVTAALGRLRKGAVIGCRGPFGQPWPVADLNGSDLVIVAGGLGLAPLRPVLYHLLRQRRGDGRAVLLVGSRTPQDLLFRRELERWERKANFQVLVTVDQAQPRWQGRVGVVPALLPHASIDPDRTAAFVCGPEVMMRFTVRELGRLGVPDERIFLSLERNMKCAIGFCGHCQYGPSFVCKDGPVLRFDRIRRFFWSREV